MSDNLGYTPGSGEFVATDVVNNAHYQRVKTYWGTENIANEISTEVPMPVRDDLLVMLSRIVKLLESNAVVDAAQRQRVSIDAVGLAGIPVTQTAAANLNATVTLADSQVLSNLTQLAGMDREQYINIAKQTYAQSIRSRLEFI